MSETVHPQAIYWNDVADEYQDITAITTQAFHLGPMLPDAVSLGLLIPEKWRGRRCLEVGSGAGQNSIFLARHGAICTAMDISERQLEHGRDLAEEAEVDVQFMLGDLDALTLQPEWELIHSTYALPFAADWRASLKALAAGLAPGGELLLTTGHPIFAGEWLELDGDGEGMFVRDYFNPPPDARFTEDNHMITARHAPVAVLLQAVIDCGLRIDAVAEPQPLNFADLDEPVLVPYYSDAWAEMYPQLLKTPVVLTIRASR